MSNKVIAFVKEHPYSTALGVGAIGLLYIVLHNSGGSAATGDDSSYLSAQASEVAAGQQFQTAQLAAQVQTNQIQAQAGVANNQISAETIAANLQSTDTLAGISAQRDIQVNSDNLSAQTTQAVSLLQAQVAEQQTAAQVAITQLNTNALVTVATAPYNAQLIHEQDQNTYLTSQLTLAGNQLQNVTGQLTSLKTAATNLLPLLPNDNTLQTQALRDNFAGTDASSGYLAGVANLQTVVNSI